MEVKSVSLFMVFLLISSAGVANGESTDQTPPEGNGPYIVGYIDTNIPKTGGGTLPVSIYYPAMTAGVGADPNTTGAPYPTLLFALGFTMTINDYRGLASTVTSWGFVFALVGSSSLAWASERAADVIDGLNWLDRQNDNSSFKLRQMMDESKFGMMGHSMGGAATVINSVSEPRFKVSVPIAPYITSSSVLPEAAANIHIPIFIVVGSSDTICPPDTMSYPLYNNGNPLKFCLTIIGKDHFTIISACPKYVVSFLKLYLYEDENYARYLYGLDAQQEIQNGTINVMYDLRKIYDYEVLSQGVLYTVSVYSDSKFLGLIYNETLDEMNSTLTGPPYTQGTANITVPRQLVPSDYKIKVEFDGESYPFTLTNSTTSYFIYLAYNHSQHQITVYWRLLGDIDGDGKVNPADFIMFAGAYGTITGQPAYNPDCDLDSDGDVDPEDFIQFAGNYGKSG